jgi:hypothetical protein
VTALATIVVVPRETFSRSSRSLERVVACTPDPFELVYVDGNAPRREARAVQRICARHHFTLLRTARYLSPNRARNLALRHVDSRYTVFLANDVLVSPGWLESLVDCAEATGAAFVSGVSLTGPPERPVVYCAGGETRIDVSANGRRALRDVHYHAGREYLDIAAELRRGPSQAAVFHCMLVRTDTLRRLGGLDEQLYVFDHIDLCLRCAREAGGGWFEPASVVVYAPPSPTRASDAMFFLLRWSKAWIDSSVTHFVDKWSLDPADSGLAPNLEWIGEHRWLPFARARGALRRRAGNRAGDELDRVVDGAIRHTLVRANTRRSNYSDSATVVIPPRHDALGG